jgi:phage-related protein
MAVVGEAHVIVRAITNKVKGDIRNGFKGSEALGSQAGNKISGAFSRAFNAAGKDGVSFFGKVSKGLQALRPGSKQAYDAFAGLQRKFYTMGTVLGGLIGGIGALGNALLALAGALGAAAPSLVAVGSAMVSLKLAGMVGKFAMKGVTEAAAAMTKEQKLLGKASREVAEDLQQLAFEAEEAALSELRAGMSLEQARENLAMVQDLPPNSRARREAELAYAEADLNMRRAIDRNKDLQEQQKKGSRGFGKNAVEQAMEGLNSYQKTFARFLSGLSKNMTRLRLVAAKGLLPPLQGAIDLLVKRGMPIFEKGVGSIAVAMGKAARSFAHIFSSAKNLKSVNALMQMSARFIEQMGKPLGNIFAVLVLLLQQAAPVLAMFTKFLNKKSKSFLEDLRLKESTGELRKFFIQAGKLTAKLGAIIGNAFGAFGGIMKSAVGKNSGGELLLDWFKEVTGKWKALRNSPEGIEKMRKSLFMGSENAKSFLQLIGDMLRTIFSALSTPNLGLFFETMRKGMPSLSAMFEEVGSALPIFGDLVVNILRFLGAFAQSGAVVDFFKILNGAAKLLADFMEKPMVQAFFKATAKIHAFALAFGLLAIYGGKGLDVLVGGMSSLTGTLDKVAQHPILAMLSALAGMFIYLYNTNSDFKKSMDETFQTIKDAVEPVMEVINLAMQEFAKIISTEVTAGVALLVKPIGDLAKVLMSLIPPLMNAIVPIMEVFVDILVAVVKVVATLAAQLVGVLVPIITIAADIFGMIVKSIEPLIDLFVDDFIPVVGDIVHQVINLVGTLIKDLAPVFKAIMDAVTPLIKVFAEMAGTVLRELANSVGILIGAFTGRGSGLGGVISGLVDMFASLGKIIMDTVVPIFNVLVTHIFPLFNQVVSTLAPVIIKMVEGILPLITMLAGAIGEILTQAINVAVPVISGLAKAFIPIIEVLLEAVIPILKTLLTSVLPLFTSIIPMITPFISTLAMVLQDVIAKVAPLIEKLMPSIMTLLGLLGPIFQAIMKVIDPLFDMFERLMPPIMSVVELLMDLAGEVLGVVIEMVTSLVESLLPVFDIFVKLMDPIESLVMSLLPPLKTIISTVVDVFITLFKSIMPVIDALLGVLIPIISTLVRTVIPPLTDLLTYLAETVAGVFNDILPAISSVLETLLPVFGTIIQEISPLIQVLVNQLGPIIKDLIIPIIQSLIDPLKSIIGTFAEIVEAIAPFISQLITDLLPVITSLIDILVPLINNVLKVLIPVISDILSAVLPLISTLVAELLPVFKDILDEIMPFVSTLIADLVPVFVQLLEVLAPVITILLDALLPLLPVVSDLFKDLLPPIIQIIKALVGMFVPALKILFVRLQPIIDIVIFLAKILVGVLGNALNVLMAILNPIIVVLVTIVDIVVGLIPLIAKGLAGAFTGITAAANIFADVFANVFGGIWGIIKNMINLSIGAFEGLINFVLDGVNGLIGGLNKVLEGIKATTFGAVDLVLEPIAKVKLPRLAKGGTVMPSPGGSIVNIAEAGKPERVVPLDSNGLSNGDKAVLAAIKDSGVGNSSGIEINVYASEGMNVKELAAEVSRQLSFSMRKGAI